MSGSQDHTVRVWNALTGKAIARPFEGHSNWVNSVAFSGDGAVGTRVVSVAGPFKCHINNVTSVAFFPDGRRVASASWDRSIRVWDAEIKEAESSSFEGHTGGIRSVAYSLVEGKQIASGSGDKTVLVWSTLR